MSEIKHVTAWSAETPDGLYYAEKATRGRKWTLTKRRGKGRSNIGGLPSFKAMSAYVEALP